MSNFLLKNHKKFTYITIWKFGKYYTFAFIDENGEPVKSVEVKINVGANNAEYINNQTNLMNVTHILLGYDGIKVVNPVKHFRNIGTFIEWVNKICKLELY